MTILDGVYIIRDDGGIGYSILKQSSRSKDIYEVVIPDAGPSRPFALALVNLLNSQGSESGSGSGES